MTLSELGAAIRANPCAWKDIPADQQAIARAALIPSGHFTAEQRTLLSCWWLQCTQDDVDAINALLPANTRVSTIQVEGLQYLSGYLLTDSLTEGNTYFAATERLQSLVAHYFTYTAPEVPR
jgi:hypothetical protein